MRLAAVTAMLLIVCTSLTASAHATTAVATAGDRLAREAQTDHQPSGNRVVETRRPLAGSFVDMALTSPASWIVPDPTAPGRSWIVVEDDGTVRQVSPAGARVLGELPAGAPPVASALADGSIDVRADVADRRSFGDPLPDARSVSSPGHVHAALVGPTDRYPHGVLGDAIEASAVEVITGSDEPARIEIEPDAVVEGIAPLLVDVTADGRAEILVTVSDAEVGARLRLYRQDGVILAGSEAIGQGFRWLHQIGAGATGPDGEMEIIAVRTPHLGGIVEAYQLHGDTLVPVARQPGFSSHRIDSRNLDMALLADVDANGRLDVIVPTEELTALGLLTRVGGGFEVMEMLELGGRLRSNVAATVDEDGRLVIAVATEDGRLRIFR